MTYKFNSLRSDILILAIILISGFKFASGIEGALDIGLYDESNYLYSGVKLTTLGFPEAQNAPLYAAWYYVISLFEPNRIKLYYLNYKLLTLLLPLFIYILCRRNRVSIHVALIISLFFLISPLNGYNWPKVSHFALIMVLTTFIIIGSTCSLFWASIFAPISALLVSYIRPEYFLTYVLSLLFFAFAITREFKRMQRLHLVCLIAEVLISILLLSILGLPLSGNRSNVAFGQHFSFHWVSWTGSQLNPWTNWQEIMSQNFGSAHTILEAFVNNPSVFLKHITYNLWTLVKDSINWAFPDIFAADQLSKRLGALYFIGICIAYFSNIRRNILKYRRLLILVGLFLLPGLVSAVFIHPRSHYLLLLWVLTGVLMATLIDTPAIEEKQMTQKQFIVLGLLIIALTPYFANKAAANRPNLETIRFIESLRIEEPVTVLEAEGGYHIYLGDNFRRVAEYDKNTGFNHFLSSRNINMIVLSNLLQKDTRFKDDAEWQHFLIEYSNLGYRDINIPNTDRKLMVRADLLRGK